MKCVAWSVLIGVLGAACGDNDEADVDAAPSCEVTTSNLGNVAATTPDWLFWIVPGPGPSVPHALSWRARHGAGTGGVMGNHVVVDGDTLVIWQVYRDVQTPRSRFIACPGMDCGQQVVLNPAAAGRLIGARAGTAYWYDAGNVASCAETGCATATVVASGLPVAQPDQRYEATLDAAGFYLAFSGEGIYVAQPGQVAVKIATETATIEGLAVTDQHVYWATATAVWRCPRTPATCTPERFAAGTAITGLDLDAADAYWLDNGQLVRCPQAGCVTPAPLRACVPFPRRTPITIVPPFLVDDTDVFCGTPGSSSDVDQIPKCSLP